MNFGNMRNTAWTTIFLFSVATSLLAQEDGKALATAIQLELNRLGCEAGQPDGIWGQGSKAALGRYAAKTGETLEDQVSDQLLTKLRSERGQFCTLPPGIVASDDRSQTAHLEAVKNSYKVWSTLTANVVSKKTEHGTLRSEAAKKSGPRNCKWQ